MSLQGPPCPVCTLAEGGDLPGALWSCLTVAMHDYPDREEADDQEACARVLRRLAQVKPKPDPWTCCGVPVATAGLSVKCMGACGRVSR